MVKYFDFFRFIQTKKSKYIKCSLFEGYKNHTKNTLHEKKNYKKLTLKAHQWHDTVYNEITKNMLIKII